MRFVAMAAVAAGLALAGLASAADFVFTGSADEARQIVREARAAGDVSTVAVAQPDGSYKIASVPVRFSGAFAELLPAGEVLTVREVERALGKASRAARRAGQQLTVEQTALDDAALSVALRADPLDAAAVLPSDKSVSVTLHNYGQRYSGSTMAAVNGQTWLDESTLFKAGGTSALAPLSTSDAKHGRYYSGFVDFTRQLDKGDALLSIMDSRYKVGGDAAPFNLTGEQLTVDAGYRHYLRGPWAVRGGVQYIENSSDIGLVGWDTKQRFAVGYASGEYHTPRLDVVATLKKGIDGHQSANVLPLLGEFNPHAGALVLDLHRRTALDPITVGVVSLSAQAGEKGLPSALLFTTGGIGRGRAQFSGTAAARSGAALDMQLVRQLPGERQLYGGMDYAVRWPGYGKHYETGSMYLGLRGQLAKNLTFDVSGAVQTFTDHQAQDQKQQKLNFSITAVF